MRRLDHVGIAVRSLAEARALWEGKLGLAASAAEEVAAQGVRVAFLPLPGLQLELLEATGSASPVARHIAKRGEGLHHVAFEVPDLRAAMREAREQGLQPLADEPGVGAGGKLVCFLHPKAAGGVLLELVQPQGRGGGPVPA
ncbi:MAG: methylmalonyl-CoA epimerase [bacterium]